MRVCPRTVVAAVAVAAAAVAASSLASSLGAAAAAVAATGPGAAPGGAVAIARQASTLAGATCASDDDCGGYAVYPPLWCRADPNGEPGLACRRFAAMGEACGRGALCIGAGNITSPGFNGCIDGTCAVRPPAAVGEPCGDRPCVPVADCLDTSFAFTWGSTLGTCVTRGYEGEVCGTPTAMCSFDLVCGEDANGGKACEGNRCAGGGPGTCRRTRAGDACVAQSSPSCADNSAPQVLACVAGVCAAQAAAGGACSRTDECDDGDLLVCAPPTGPACDFPGCPVGVAGTCRPLAVGDPCAFNCAGGDLVCELTGHRTLVQACVRLKAEGEACELRGAANVCGTSRTDNNRLLCIGGRCSATSAGAALGDECWDDFDQCTGNTTCGDPGGVPHAVCIASKRGAWGDACGVDAGFVKCGARLRCNRDFVCESTAPTVTGPGKWGWQCIDTFGCESTVEPGTGAVLECRNSRTRPAGGRRCTYIRDAGAACDVETPDDPVDCAGGLVCAGGECRPEDAPRRPVGEACLASDECDGAAAAPPVAACRGAANDWLDRCVAVGPPGSTCDNALVQCSGDGDCIDGRCVGKTPLGSPCSSSEECAFGGECWRGAGAVGRTCRAWVGLGESCDNVASKCWRELRCGDGGVCENPSGSPLDDLLCNTDADCTALDGVLPGVCQETDRAGGRRRCRAVLSPGQPCASGSSVCAVGYRCTRDFTPAIAVCARDAGRGDACGGEPGVYCAEGLTCMDGECGTTGAAGEQCDGDGGGGAAGCADGLACRQRSNPDRNPGTVCGTPVAAGELCSDDEWRLCAAGQWCLPASSGPVCKLWRGRGETCGGAGEACWLDLICFEGVCA